MFTVAIVGADGAGKTTAARGLIESAPVPMKYLYMGGNIESSNIALPTSRLIFWVKRQYYKRVAKKSGNKDSRFLSTHHVEHRFDKRGKIGAALRLLHRIAEEWYRQFVAWRYLRRGCVVVYDRHFLFDVAPRAIRSRVQKQRTSDRLHYWLLSRWFPHPDLVIFLDAPPELLYERKGEATIEYLRGRRGAFLEQGKKTPYFIRVDASQTAAKVLEDVSRHVMEYYARRAGRTPDALSGPSPATS